MNEIIVRNQAEMDAVPEDFDGKIVIAAGNEMVTVRRRYRNPVEARDNSRVTARDDSAVMARGNSTVEALENSTVEARGNSTVEAWDNSTVTARDNSTVEARGNSTVEARGNSTVEAWDNSTVTARDDSTVEARGNSTVEARGNSTVVASGNGRIKAAWNAQVLDFNRKNNIEICGNARIVYNPSTIEEWANFSGIEIKNGKILLYKAVHKIGGRYISDFDKNFQYKVGVDVESKGFCSDPNEDCGKGIHLSTIQWAADFGRRWDDIAILELEADAAEIVVPLYETGKVRVPRAKVIREVSLEEAGLIGKMIYKRRKK